MVRFFIRLLAVSVLAACGCDRERENVSPASDTPDWQRGDRLVFEVRAGEFFEARVIEVEGDELRVQHIGDGASATLSSSDAYRLPPPKETLARDQLVVCALRPGEWMPCQVRTASDHDVEVVAAHEASARVPRSRVLVPRELTRMNLERSFAKARRQLQFERAAARAGRPLVPEGWSPAPREKIIAERNGAGWYSSSVHEIEKDRVHVRWEADRRVTEVAMNQIAPQGPYQPDPSLDGFVLARPQSPAQAWEPRRVRGLVDEHGVVLEDARGQRETRLLRDVVVLSKSLPR